MLTITPVRKFMLAGSVALSLLMVAGCGSSNKEGSSVETLDPSTPVTLAKASQNITASITAVDFTATPQTVTLTLKDQNGKDISPADIIASPSGRFRFYLARLDNTGASYTNYLTNSSGVPTYEDASKYLSRFTSLGNGVYRYAFNTDFKANNGYLPNLTHIVAAQISRDYMLPVINLKVQQAVNPYLTFRPDGNAVAVTRELVSIEACNECHGQLGVHGGSRREIALCSVCHYSGVTATGTSFENATTAPVDLATMIHRIHMGKKLPSGKYSVGSTDFTKVGYPFISGDATITGTPIECTKCHRQGKDLAGKPYGKDADKWKAQASAKACGTCHDGKDYTSAAHFGTDCTSCHTNSNEFGGTSGIPDVVGAHTVFEKSAAYTGINFKILSIQNATVGNKPTIRFKITDNTGAAIPFDTTTSFSLKLGYMPGADYTNADMAAPGQPNSFTLSAANTTLNPIDNTYTATFGTAIPATASGVAVIGLEGRKTFTYRSHTATIGGESAQYYFDPTTGEQVTDTTKLRRTSVDVSKCNACHSRLSLHGANRVNSISECVICHNPNATDKNRRPASPVDGLAEQSIDFKVMIHKIHTGEALSASSYVIYGFGGSVNDFKEVQYPRDRSDCLACHTDLDAVKLPLADGVLGTTTTSKTDPSQNTRTLPMRAVCTSCHDSSQTTSHVTGKTIGVQENCIQCHAPGLVNAVDNVHNLK